MPMNRRRAACLWLLMGALGMTAGQTMAQSFPMTMEGYSVVSQMTPAPVRSTVSLGIPYRAVAVGATLQILDETDPPGHLQAVSQLTLPGAAQDLLFRDGMLYIAAGQFGLILVRVENPLIPLYISGFKVDNALKLAMNEGGKVLYVCNGTSQFQAINVEDPFRPKTVSYGFVPNANIYDIAVTNQTLVAACGAKGLVVFNLEHPGYPLRVKRFEDLKAANRIAVDRADGNLLAVADGDLGLVLVNFSNWKTPVLKGSLAFAAQALDVGFLVGRERVVVALGTGGYAVVDVSDSSNPVALSQPLTPTPTVKVNVEGLRPYLLCSASGMYSLDASTPTHPVTTLVVPGDVVFGALAIEGSTAFISRDSAIEIWNFSDPGQPTPVGSVATPVQALDLLISGDLLLAGCQQEGVLLFDISNPATPVLLSTFPVGGSAGQMAVSGDLLAIADGSDGVVLADITNPSAPVAVGIWNAKEGYVGGVAFSGQTTLWVRQSMNGLTALDVTSLSAIKELGKLALDGEPGRLYLQGGNIIATSGHSGWDVVNPTDPAKPALIAEIADGAIHASFSGTRMLSCDGDTGLREYDLTTPSSPLLVSFFGAPTFAYQADFLPDGTRLLSCREGGLWSLVPTSCAGSKLLLPCEGSVLSRFYRAAFTWQGVEGITYVVQVSNDPTFPDNTKKTKTSAATVSKLSVPFWVPSVDAWPGILKLAKERATLYWRVAYKLNKKDKIFSETRTLTIP
jgi:hypothetical protein